MPSDYPLIGLLGGSFDPIHKGHLYLAQTAMRQLSLKRILFLPAQAGAHKEHFHVADHHRLAMLSAALAPYPNWHIDTRDLDRGIPTRTIDSLSELSRDHPLSRWVLLLGGDQWQSFTQWQSWKSILYKAHLAVLERQPGSSPAHETCPSPLKYSSIEMLHKHSSGAIVRLDAPAYVCSSTAVRSGQSALLPPVVAAYIHQHHLYEI